MIESKWMTRNEAAEYLRMSPKTLANLASLDRGPRFRKASPRHVLYLKEELDAYVNGNEGLRYGKRPAKR